MARISTPAERVLDQQQQRLDELAKPALVAPGMDRTGMPAPLMGTVGSLAEMEQQSRHRFSPRKARWGDVHAFDQRVAELDAQREEISAKLTPLRHQLANAAQTDADAHAAWIGRGEKGQPPESVRPALEQEVEALERESDGLMRASSLVLQEKHAYVEKHRGRLTKSAERLVEQAQANYLALIDSLASARDELVACREAQLWAQCYPADGASGMPPLGQYAGGDQTLSRKAGFSQVTQIERVYEALRVDGRWLTNASTARQREIIGGRKSAVWVDSDQGQEDERKWKRDALEDYKEQWGRYPA